MGEDKGRGYVLRRESYKEGAGPPDFDDEDRGYEQWEEGYVVGDSGSIEETYLLDPDELFDENDLLFAENVFEPHMMGSPVPKDGLQSPDVPGEELDEDDATTDPYAASDDGRIYYPPEDAPTQPSRQRRDADVAVGFGTSADDVALDEVDVPERFDVSDQQIAANVQQALRLHSETQDLNIRVQVQDGIATLRGQVDTLADVASAEDIASEIEGVEEVREQLTLG